MTDIFMTLIPSAGVQCRKYLAMLYHRECDLNYILCMCCVRNGKTIGANLACRLNIYNEDRADIFTLLLQYTHIHTYIYWY